MYQITHVNPVQQRAAKLRYQTLVWMRKPRYVAVFWNCR